MARVLIVDDEEGIQLTFREFLREEGHDVYVAASIDEGLERLRQVSIDVLITDIIMPQRSGLDLLHEIHTSHPHVKPIVITGGPSVETCVTAMRSGALDYLSKPVLRQDLVRVVASVAKQKAEQDAMRIEFGQMCRERAAWRVLNDDFAVLALQCSDGVMVLDENGNVLYANQAVAEFVGRPLETLTSCTIHDFVPPEEAQFHIGQVREAVRLGKGFVREQRLTSREGTFLHRVYIQPLTPLDGQPVRVLFIASNWEAQREVEKRLHESEERYRELVEQIDEGVALIDTDECVRFANRSAAIMLSRSPDSLVGQRLDAFMRPDQFTKVKEQTALRRQGRKTIYELELRTRTGEDRYTLVTASPRLDRSGAFTGTFAIFHDITDVRRAEVAGKANDARARRLFESSNEGIVFVQNDRILFANRKIGELLGLAPEQLVGMPIEAFLHPAEREDILMRRQRIGAGQPAPSLALSLLGPDERWHPMSLHLNRFTLDDIPTDMIVIRPLATPFDGAR